MRRRLASALLAGVGLGLACDDDGDDSRCGPRSAVVARVIDGDTVELDDGTRVRYLMIDAPELGPAAAECYGSEAHAFNRALVEGRMVSLAYDRECEDDYGRLLAYVELDGRDLSALLIERGFACVLHIPPNGDDRVDELEALESSARAGGLGLWSACAEVGCG